MAICDKANSNASVTVNYLKKKIVDSNTNVVLYALTVADALVKNCNIDVHREISSRGFLDLLVKQLQNNNVHEIAKQKILYYIKQWNNAFSKDPTLSYCSEVYNKLKRQNYSFEEPKTGNNNNDKIKQARLKQKEEEDLQLALALSLSSEESKNNKKSSKKKDDSSLSSPVQQQSSQQSKVLFKVKALYDFLGNYAEGELPLYCGDIINVYDTTYKDWWKGENRGMVGIFPNNYVEKIQESSTSHQVDNEYESQVLNDAQKIDEFMQILSRVDPKSENLSENDELQNLYNSICTLRPKLVKLVEYYSKKMEETSLLSTKFLQAQETYRSLLEQQQQQLQQQPLYAQIQQPYAPYIQQQQPQQQQYIPQQPIQQYIPQQPTTAYPLSMPGTQATEMAPSQPSIPITPPGKIEFDPRLTQPQQQPQQSLYMQPYAPGMDPNVAYQGIPVQSSAPLQMPNPYDNSQLN
ncbi:hypothetical protein BCR36DRAFT_25497 [Piromyces finnis]|uniref:Class E vacuolar protein-sorting machinery protein HSE1 n=1 Tax=Piromyces finnis TaxID=1754191 RepID=A0A1Y1VDH9_9FUNG|nr:hypothetical protein BCR36DRAFT_25497 [Piromyces finnis]|eukprot:ORX53391.1 hypothetical protein BCR36DRAFT_25497 [Piromyces finnis]